MKSYFKGTSLQTITCTGTDKKQKKTAKIKQTALKCKASV